MHVGGGNIGLAQGGGIPLVRLSGKRISWNVEYKVNARRYTNPDHFIEKLYTNRYLIVVSSAEVGLGRR